MTTAAHIMWLWVCVSWGLKTVCYFSWLKKAHFVSSSWRITDCCSTCWGKVTHGTYNRQNNPNSHCPWVIMYQELLSLHNIAYIEYHSRTPTRCPRSSEQLSWLGAALTQCSSCCGRRFLMIIYQLWCCKAVHVTSDYHNSDSEGAALMQCLCATMDMHIAYIFHMRM